MTTVSCARKLRTAGLLGYRRKHRVLFHRLANGFPHQLVEHCLRQLLTICQPFASEVSS